MFQCYGTAVPQCSPAYHFVSSCVDSYIDHGKNPQLYTKHCMEKSLARNESVKGKIETFKVRCGFFNCQMYICYRVI